MIVTARITFSSKLKHRFTRLKSFFSKPIERKYARALRNHLKTEIRNIPNYHRYTSTGHPIGRLERSVKTVVGRSCIYLSMSATQAGTDYAKIVEYGIGNRTAKGKKMFVFRGYRPNTELIARALQHKEKSEHLDYWKSLSKKRYRKRSMELRGVTRAVAENAYTEVSDAPDVPDYSRNFFKGRRISRAKKKRANKGKAYKYGIYTIFAKKVRGTPPRHVMKKTAEWAKGYFKKEFKRKIRAIVKR